MQKFETLRQPLMWFWIAVVKEEKKYLKKWPPSFLPAAKGSTRTLLGPIKASFATAGVSAGGCA